VQEILLTLTLYLRFFMIKLNVNICRDFLVDGLTIMKNRGYDSAGLATMAAEGGSMVRNVG
jgi:glucosamine 6-phosphate synthetase-like amidotransferase/phosphosugar isomerase protein